MANEIVGEFVLRPIFEILAHFIGYYTSRILCPIFTFGYITVAPAAKKVKVKPKWHGFNKGSNGKIVLHEEMGALLGIVFWLLVLVLNYFIYAKFNT